MTQRFTKLSRARAVGSLAAVSCVALAFPALSFAWRITDEGHYYTVAPNQEQTEYKHVPNPWEIGQAQYNGECEGCGHVDVRVGIRGSFYVEDKGRITDQWGYRGSITAFVSQYDPPNPGASHTIWGWFAYE